MLHAQELPSLSTPNNTLSLIFKCQLPHRILHSYEMEKFALEKIC